MPVAGYYNGTMTNPSVPAVPIDERGHQFGDGVYEVIRVYGGTLFLLDWHLDRLWMSMEAIRIPNPWTKEEMTNQIESVLAQSGEVEASIYLQVTRGAANRNHLFPPSDTKPSLSIVVRPAPLRAAVGPGKLLMQPDERWANAYIKTINLLPNILAKQLAHDASADEALLVREGRMIESASSNLWFVREGKLITAPADRFILAGITRRYVMMLAADLGIPVTETKLPISELQTVDGMFITGTLSEILPIDTVLTHPAVPVDAVGTLPTTPPHPIHVSREACSVVWQAKSLDMVHQIRGEFERRIDALR